MAGQLVEDVEREIAEREWSRSPVELRRVRRVGDQVLRLLVRDRGRIAGALAKRRRDLLIEGGAADAVVALEEGAEVGTAKSDLSRRAVVLQLTASDDAQRRRVADRDARRSGNGRVAEGAIRLAVVGVQSRRSEGVVEPAGGAVDIRVRAQRRIGAGLERCRT